MGTGEMLISNLCLLGYEKEASAAKITLSDDLFEHANERAFQSVCHFLLRFVDEDRCKLTFRHCWPVLDKKQSADFRQAVVAWLKEIKQGDPEAAGLPLINPALFLSPGGRKFKGLILAFTQYVLIKSMRSLERRSPGGDVLLARGNPDTQCAALRASCLLAKQQFVELQKRRLVCHTHHQRFADSFSSTYRRLRTSASSLIQEVGRLVAVSELPPELTHRLLQEDADQVAPAVYGAARQHLLALCGCMGRLQLFCREVDYSWRVVDSIISGAVDNSVIDAAELAAPPADRSGSQSDVVEEHRMDLVAFFDTFVARADHLKVFLEHCNLAQLKGLHGTLPPLVADARQLAADAARLLAEAHSEADAAQRRTDQLLAEAAPAPPGRWPRPTGGSPPPLLAPTTPNWSLSTAPPLPPGDHPLKHMYRTPLTDDTDSSQVPLDVSTEPDVPSIRLSSDLTSVTSGQSAWSSPSSAAERSRSNQRLQLSASDHLFHSTSPAGGTSPSSFTAAASRLRDMDRLAVGRDASDAGGRSSCSSLFSPLASERRRTSERPAAAGPEAELGPEMFTPSGPSLASVNGSAAEAAPEEAPLSGSPSAEVLALRERTSALIRSLTRSPAASPARALADRCRAAADPHLPQPPGPIGGASEHPDNVTDRPSVNGAAPAPGGAAEDPATPRAASPCTPSKWKKWDSPPGAVRGETEPGAKSDSSPPDGAATYRVETAATGEGDTPANLSYVTDQMAESLAMSMFGSIDFNHSLELSLNTRESLGGVEIPLVGLDDSDTSGQDNSIEPPTDVLVDI